MSWTASVPGRVGPPRRERRARARPAEPPLAALRMLAAPLPVLWTITLLMALACPLAMRAAGLALEGTSLAAGAALALACLLTGAAFTVRWPVATLRAMALATGFLVAFTGALGVLHYCAAALGRPLVDARLAEIEAALGFDWPAAIAWLDAHPALAGALALAYHTSGPQVALAIVVLAATHRFARLWAYVRLFAVTLLVTVAVASAFPAAGAYAHYRPDLAAEEAITVVGGVWHLGHIAQLRAGEGLLIGLHEIRGLATFPSFHVCLAVLTAWAVWPVRVVGGLALALNLLVILGTVSAGGHYLPDLAAGGALALAAIAGQELRRRRPLERRPVILTA